MTSEKIQKLKKKAASLFEDGDEETKNEANPLVTEMPLSESMRTPGAKQRKMTTGSKHSNNEVRLSHKNSNSHTDESSEYGHSGNSLEGPIISERHLRMSMMSENFAMSGYYQPELPFGTESSIFSVSDPIKGKPVTYLVRGVDMEGPFEINRRYNDFYNFYRTLIVRWPGIYIPPIPPKKVGSNKDEKYLRERRIFLEKFIRVLGENEFIVHSEEFKIFSRHTGNIEKVFKVLPKLTSDVLLKRFQSCLEFSETPDISQTKNCVTEINEFSSFAKKAQNLLKDMRDRFKAMVKAKQDMDQHYVSMNDLFTKYEDNNLKEYCEGIQTR